MSSDFIPERESPKAKITVEKEGPDQYKITITITIGQYNKSHTIKNNLQYLQYRYQPTVVQQSKKVVKFPGTRDQNITQMLGDFFRYLIEGEEFSPDYSYIVSSRFDNDQKRRKQRELLAAERLRKQEERARKQNQRAVWEEQYTNDRSSGNAYNPNNPQ